jgi:hypothetical protein
LGKVTGAARWLAVQAAVIWFGFHSLDKKMVILGRAVKMGHGIRERIAFCRMDVYGLIGSLINRLALKF